MDISNYIHSTYYIIFIDHWDRDSSMMIIHHLIATLMLTISYMIHLERMAVVVIYLLEICEVFYFILKYNYSSYKITLINGGHSYSQ
ncbi:hypothetical protein BLA29_010148 [Euroglyphus maynei]|uniref:TLC domain-containing protein n=1 Tax=Euroglyphus maynei TaxID=6958 RepID=A0A1Y3BPN5_EURMA|nr:hypothetical protein BLA29_010148 [Euroglyphus maynei]